MFRSSTILRELVQGLAKVIFVLKYSVKLHRCISCGDVAACRKMACVLFVVQTESVQYIDSIMRGATLKTPSLSVYNFSVYLYLNKENFGCLFSQSSINKIKWRSIIKSKIQFQNITSKF